MAALYQALKERLLKSGCTISRQGKGSHEIGYSPITNKSFTVPIALASRHMANVILKQAGLGKSF
ncbi:MAG: type II toxin-antitoxin system HicA family toxin [Methylobacter sp.]|nr:type II toxin-antitoxin system HicA family toxin [Methylobacter sp.]